MTRDFRLTPASEEPSVIDSSPSVCDTIDDKWLWNARHQSYRVLFTLLK